MPYKRTWLILCVSFVEFFLIIFGIWRLDFKDDTRNNYELYDILNRKKVFTRPFYIDFWTRVGKVSMSFYILGCLTYTHFFKIFLLLNQTVIGTWRHGFLLENHQKESTTINSHHLLPVTTLESQSEVPVMMIYFTFVIK